MTMYKTLLLDRTAWDLIVDSAGNIACAAPPYALAQDVASAVRLFLNELWYAPGSGIPYFDDILGTLPPPALLMGYIEAQALRVPGVISAQCIIEALTAREVRGQIQFTDESGAVNAVSF